MFKRNSAKVAESEFWVQIDPESGKPIGEPKEVDVVLKRSDRNNFMITYLATIIELIDRLGNQKMKVVKYLLAKMGKYDNIIVKTVREIAKETGMCTKTVVDTLRILEEANIISRRPGVIMMSPKLLHRGNAQKERYLMTKFEEIQGVQFVNFSDDFNGESSHNESEKTA